MDILHKLENDIKKKGVSGVVWDNLHPHQRARLLDHFRIYPPTVMAKSYRVKWVDIPSADRRLIDSHLKKLSKVI
jgi:hypothetical protein